MFLPEGRRASTWICALMGSMEALVWWQRHLCRGRPGARCQDEESINFWGWPGVRHQSPRKVQRASLKWDVGAQVGWGGCPCRVGGPLWRGRTWMGRKACVFRSDLAQGVKTQTKRLPGEESWCGVLEPIKSSKSHAYAFHIQTAEKQRQRENLERSQSRGKKSP